MFKSSKSFIRFSISFARHFYALIFYLNVLVCHSYVSRLYSYVICMSLVCTRMSSVCHSSVTRMYSCVIRVSLLCTRMPSVCHSYVLTCLRMSLVCARMSSVCHSYVLVCHPYVIRRWFYHEPLKDTLTLREDIF